MDKYPALYLPQLKELISLSKFGDHACTVGRDQSTALPLTDLTCSRIQFSVTSRDGQCVLESLSRTVPTMVNGAVVSSPAVLKHDDKITCGSTTLVFLDRDAAAPASPAIAPSDRGGIRARFGSGPAASPGETVMGTVPVAPPPVQPPAEPVNFAPPAAPPPAGPQTSVRSGFAQGRPPRAQAPPAEATQSFPQATVVGNFREEMEALQHPGEIRLDRSAIIGRAPEDDGIVLDHPRVSRKHAEVRVASDKIFLRDLGSSNGTFLNGERITGHRELRAGDRIDIGPFSFRFTGFSLVKSSREGNLRVVGRGLTRIVKSHSTGQMVKILDDVTIVIEPGEFVCILGSSGSGKTTLMQALSARQPAQQGQVFLNDVSLYANFQSLKQSIALVPQKDVLHEDLTLEECIRFTARLRLPVDTNEAGLRDSVQQAIAKVDLSHRSGTPIRHLSGGQKKRAALANETVCKPELLFLDEVTSGLDEGTDWEMMRLFRKMADEGMTVICVTHTVANVEDFCHKLVVMAPPGMLAYYGPPEGAKQYFGVDKLGDLYRKLSESSGEEWRNRFVYSDEYRRYIQSPLRENPGNEEEPAKPANQSGRMQDALPEIQRQLNILTSRFSKLLMADRKTLLTAFAQSALIGLFLVMVYGTVPHPDPKEFSLVFFLGISCFWCGCNNASKEIVKERFLYAMERDVNLSIPSYLLSKAIMLGLFGIVQVAILFGIVKELGSVPGDATRQFLSMCMAVLAGTATGLFLSAIAKTEDQASTLVPIALIPQILLSGIIVQDLPQIPDLIAHVGISGFWVYRAMQSVLTTDLDKANYALMILGIHTLVFLAAAGATLFLRDSRGQMVYGKAVNQRIQR